MGSAFGFDAKLVRKREDTPVEIIEEREEVETDLEICFLLVLW